MVQEKRLEAIAKYESQITSLRRKLTNLNAEYAKMLRSPDVAREDKDMKLNSIRDSTSLLTQMEKKLKETQAQHTFFHAVLNAIEKVEEQSCLICLETMQEGDTITIARWVIFIALGVARSF